MLENAEQKPTGATQSGAPAVLPNTATAATNQQAAPTAEQITAALKANPELLRTIKLPTKVEGQSGEESLEGLVTGFQTRKASDQRFAEAKQMREEAQRLRDETAQRGDPMEQLVTKWTERNKPQPPDPVDTLLQDEFYSPIREAVKTERTRTATAIQTLTQQNQDLQTKLTEMQANVTKQVQNLEAWRRFERQIDDAAKNRPGFTARVVVDAASGETRLDYGDNPLMETVVRLSTTTDPQPILGGRAGRSMPLGEVFDAVMNKGRETVRAIEQAEAARAERERRDTASTISDQGLSWTGFPDELTSKPGDSKEVQSDKAGKRVAFLENLARTGR
jgi:hypothetical protein